MARVFQVALYDDIVTLQFSRDLLGTTYVSLTNQDPQGDHFHMRVDMIEALLLAVKRLHETYCREQAADG